ncbi:kinase-like domain-containing protein [Crucibulum laeve]|uniref:non-specific serine/threonine protein kinase n=1 Tax=Crucibulum laeve TaxID=68775 RepID=A0A5C3M9E0_9AGAR|nr:kinase-like domain-containing protein [Crucibulum laeve]
MAPKQPCEKYQYVVTSSGPRILPVDQPSCKDEESPADYNAGGYLPVKVNDTFKHGRYRVIRKLGWGHFSTVWLVKDSQTHQHSALKVVKSAGRYAETARDEIKLLSRVQSFSPTHLGRSHIVSFLDSFSHQGPEASHVCIVFEPLGENLLALIERNKKKGVPRTLVKVIAKQILLGLQYLHDECDLVHTDIKPENILISIPDIEAHIHTELSQSPSPTSRRVGVPLPTKSRAGVTIPYNQQRTRRQVQIFDSQPLASPGSRSAGKGAGTLVSNNMSAQPGDSGSGGNSQSGSYIAQMHLTRLGAVSTGAPTYASGTAASLSSSAPKVPSCLSASMPQIEHVLSKKSEATPSHKESPASLRANVQQTSPSTSSSSSSISSALALTGSSSITSTPPTSISHSLGNAMSFIGLVKFGSLPKATLGADNDERDGLAIVGKKGKGKMTENEDEDEEPSSWKIPSLAGSLKDKFSSSLSSSYKSTTSRNGKSKLSRPPISHGQSRSQSGPPNTGSFWKDPGTAAPAPAVVVSAVAGADAGGSDFFELDSISAVNSIGGSTASGSSTATATAARPSPTGTPQPVAGGSNAKVSKPSSLLNGVTKIITDTSNAFLGQPDAKPSASSDALLNTINHPPSLLTQTAPSKAAPIPSSSMSKRTIIRSSPPQQISQLSAHMHTHQPPSLCNCSDATHKHRTISRTNAKSRPSRMNNHDPPAPAAPLSPTSVTPTPTSPSPAPPPPTPVASPSMASIIPQFVTASTAHPNLATLPPLQTPVEKPLALLPPPISIKIADLGNATPSTKHYTEDIQTRQYRAPEAILGRRDWDARADIWSVACLLFELLTAEYLFDPQGHGEMFTKDDDHMAQIIELLGDFPMEIKMGGKYSRELFDHSGALRYIRTLKPWPLKRVMTEKYLFAEQDATSLCAFLEPMLTVDMRNRKHAREMIDHPWLSPSNDDGEAIDW